MSSLKHSPTPVLAGDVCAACEKELDRKDPPASGFIAHDCGPDSSSHPVPEGLAPQTPTTAEEVEEETPPSLPGDDHRPTRSGGLGAFTRPRRELPPPGSRHPSGMAFERRPFDPDAVRRRAAQGIDPLWTDDRGELLDGGQARAL